MTMGGGWGGPRTWNIYVYIYIEIPWRCDPLKLEHLALFRIYGVTANPRETQEGEEMWFQPYQSRIIDHVGDGLCDLMIISDKKMYDPVENPA